MLRRDPAGDKPSKTKLLCRSGNLNSPVAVMYRSEIMIAAPFAPKSIYPRTSHDGIFCDRIGLRARLRRGACLHETEGVAGARRAVLSLGSSRHPDG
jgi:hypothetical protein